MKVLQLCNKPPLPPIDGGALAINAVTQGLLDAGCSVKVLSVTTHKHPFLPDRIPAAWLGQTAFESVEIDTRVKPLAAFLNLFGKSSYNISRFYSKAFEAKLEEILRADTFDIIHLESLFLTPYLPSIRRLSKAPVVLRAHNVEYRIWQRMAENENGLLRGKYLSLLASRLETYERETLQLLDGIAAITETDAAQFKTMGFAKPLLTLPFALTLPDAPAADAAEPGTVFHLAAMDWQPNIEAVSWLLEKVWPLVLRDYPEAKLHLAGRQMPDRFLQLQRKNIFVTGEVTDAYAYMSRYTVMAVPLLSGAGMRVKVAEGLSLGKAIVTTPVGIEGIPATDGVHALIASTAEAFAAALVRCLRDKDLQRELGRNGRELAQENFERRRATGKLLDFYTRLISNSSGR